MNVTTDEMRDAFYKALQREADKMPKPGRTWLCGILMDKTRNCSKEYGAGKSTIF